MKEHRLGNAARGPARHSHHVVRRASDEPPQPPPRMLGSAYSSLAQTGSGPPKSRSMLSAKTTLAHLRTPNYPSKLPFTAFAQESEELGNLDS